MSSKFVRAVQVSLVAAVTLVGPTLTTRASAESCFATDNDGTFDQDGSVNGIITITSASASMVAPATTPYDCSALDFVLESGGELTFQGDEATGAIVSFDVGSLTIDLGGAIRANGNGCVIAFLGGISSEPAEAPDATNVCIVGGPGVGGNGDDFGGAGGGGHGGAGATGGSGGGGTTYDSATAPSRFGATGGGTSGAGGGAGGAGGGVVHITTGAFTHNGEISADGLDGGGTEGRAAGGGAGGTIFIEATTFDGTTGTFTARGGDAPGSAGGGGGGRISIVYGNGSFDLDAGDFDVDGGVGGTVGAKGTVYVKEISTSTVEIFHGFTFADVDHEEDTWLADPSATNQYCDLTLANDATPSITAGTITLGGEIDCSRQVASFDVVQTAPAALLLPDSAVLSVNGALTLDAGTALEIGAGVTIANTLESADLVVGLPDGDDHSWSDVTIDAAPGGRLVIDAAIALALTDGTTIRGNAQWPNLTALSIDATSTLHADGKGCAITFDGIGAEQPEAPDDANVCVPAGPGAGSNGDDFGGAGGGGHGGTGATGGSGRGGTSYDSATTPSRIGATGGSTSGAGGGAGGAGGGLIEITVGTLTHDGVIRADGLDGGGSPGRAAGGGAGGSVTINAGSIEGTSGTFLARGGGAVGTAGGGGGGRIALLAETISFDFDAADFDVSGGAGGSAGEKGTVYVRENATSSVEIFHGFTFADVDHVEVTWTADPSATNQYCDVTLPAEATPSITAESVSLGGTIDCDVPVASFTVTQTGPSGALSVADDAIVSAKGDLILHATTSLEMGAGATLANTLTGSDLTLDLPDGDDQAWSNVTIDGAAEGRFFIDAALALELADSTTVAANARWPNLTALAIDVTSSINADAKGCTNVPAVGGGTEGAQAPDCDNVCTPGATGSGQNGADAGGSGGGGHGGTGGNGGVGTGGATYDYARIPRLFGATAGNLAGSVGGAGGGLIRITVSDTLSNDGTIAARGGNGIGVAGGGAGGTVNITASTYTCTVGGSFAAGGGAAALVGNSGGGGGGRILIDAANDSCVTAPLTLLTAAANAPGGIGFGGAENGDAGTVSLDAQALACADPLGITAARKRTGRASVTNATDALFVLRASVQLECCDLCACDVNGSSDISATDALITLKVAVGESLPLQCPPCT